MEVELVGVGGEEGYGRLRGREQQPLILHPRHNVRGMVGQGVCCRLWVGGGGCRREVVRIGGDEGRGVGVGGDKEVKEGGGYDGVLGDSASDIALKGSGVMVPTGGCPTMEVCDQPPDDVGVKGWEGQVNR